MSRLIIFKMRSDVLCASCNRRQRGRDIHKLKLDELTNSYFVLYSLNALEDGNGDAHDRIFSKDPERRARVGMYNSQNCTKISIKKAIFFPVALMVFRPIF